MGFKHVKVDGNYPTQEYYGAAAGTYEHGQILNIDPSDGKVKALSGAAVSADGLQIDPDSAGTFEIVSFEGTTKGSRVTGRFVTYGKGV